MLLSHGFGGLPGSAWRSKVRQPLAFGHEAQRHSVVAVAFSGQWGPVVEDMPLVSAAAPAVVLRPGQQELEVPFLLDPSLDRLEEAWPARTAIELRRRVKQGEKASCAHKGADPLLLVERAGKGALRVLFEQHTVGLRRDETAPRGVRAGELLEFRRGDGRHGGYASGADLGKRMYSSIRSRARARP